MNLFTIYLSMSDYNDKKELLNKKELYCKMGFRVVILSEGNEANIESNIETIVLNHVKEKGEYS